MKKNTLLIRTLTHYYKYFTALLISHQQTKQCFTFKIKYILIPRFVIPVSFSLLKCISLISSKLCSFPLMFPMLTFAVNYRDPNKAS